MVDSTSKCNTLIYKIINFVILCALVAAFFAKNRYVNQKYYFCKDSYERLWNLNSNTLSEIFEQDEKTGLVVNHLENYSASRLQLAGLMGSSRSITVAAVYNQLQTNHLIILPDKETSAYFLNDLENLFGEKSYSYHKKKN